MSRRDKAFATPPPADWVPKEDEIVWINPRKYLGATGRVITVVSSAGGDSYVLVEVCWGRRRSRKQFALSDLRP